ncbi:conserved hypothetical protein [Trichinella spiralis]|uniref:hypothetical protein n=1 Tax=Trichinella spiralis TaxID=6334 RepID=UPI0001EFDABC|nr:conserved hypothetical protein [Trichinella spiralis]
MSQPVLTCVSSRPSVPLLITNTKKEFDIVTAIEHVAVHPSILFLIAMDYSQLMALSNCGSYGSDENCFVFNVLVRNCEDESRILNDLHRITIFSLLQSPLRALGI